MPFELIETGNSLVMDKISRLRDKRTGSEEYVRLLGDLSSLLGFHVARDYPTRLRSIATPKCPTTRQEFIPESCRTLVFSLFRAALPMAEKVKALIPNVGIVHVVYKAKRIIDIKELPDSPSEYLREHRILIADPIIGTGRSVLSLLKLLQKYHVSVGDVRIICLAAATQGIEAIGQQYPRVRIVGLVEERELLPDGYLTPGFGDVGNRVFGLVQ
jgi:uracil phosphoribosyltransferase